MPLDRSRVTSLGTVPTVDRTSVVSLQWTSCFIGFLSVIVCVDVYVCIGHMYYFSGLLLM